MDEAIDWQWKINLLIYYSTVALDLQICQLAEDLSIAPSSFLLFVVSLPSSSLFQLNSTKFTEQGINQSV